MSMAVRKNDFMPSWLQSPNGEGQKAWKSGSGRDGLYSTSDSHAPPVTPSAPTTDGRRYSSFSLHNDTNSSRRSQRALSFEASEHSTYSRPTRPVSSYRRPASFKSDFKGGSGSGGGGGSVDSFSRLPRQRSMDGWPRPEVNSSNQGLERNFHQHFPSLRATSAAPADNSAFNPGGAWENRHTPSSSRSHYSHVNSNSGYDSRRHAHPSHSLDSSPTDEEAAAHRSAMKPAVRPDRILSTHHDSLFDSAHSSSAERSNMRLNLALNPANQADSEKAAAPLRQAKAQSPNGGKVTLRSLSKSEAWKSQKIEEPTTTSPAPAHSAVAPWSSQAPPPPPAMPRSTVARTPEAPAVILQRQIETRSKGAAKGTSESRLNFFKSLQGHGRSAGPGSMDDSPTDLTPASESNPLVEEERILSSDCSSTSSHSSTHQAHLKDAEKTACSTSSYAESRTSSEDSPLEEQQRNGALDRDHLTASFYDVVINSGKIPFDDTDDVNEEDRRVMKVWGWTPDAYDNVECITLGEVAKFQAVLRSYVSKKLQTDFVANSSLGAQRLFQRHHRYLTIPSSIDASLSSSDCSASSSSSASSDEDRK